MKTSSISVLAICIALLTIFGFTSFSIDDKLRQVIRENDLGSKTFPAPSNNPFKVELGRMLFFDKLLSGNKDISCATCHHPSLASADAIPLPIGVGGRGMGPERTMGAERERIPRNSPDVFNRGAKEWHTMFWDSRVSGSPEYGFQSPADEKLPEGLDNLLAAQALFPVTSPDEMRGEPGDLDVFGERNEIALISPASEHIIWHRLMLRIMEYPKYRQLFAAAFPDVSPEEIGFQHAANAIAAFEIAAFTFQNSPWDQYIAGHENALNNAQKRGAALFYGKANCFTCHSGSLMTDQQAHNIGVPQFGPGKGNAKPIDVGRYAETGRPEDLFAFRTPSLQNVTITGPYMHNGAYARLEDAVLHHFEPEAFLRSFTGKSLPESLRATIREDEKLLDRILRALDPGLPSETTLDKSELKDLLAFLEALTDEKAREMDHVIPRRVPSGLPVID